MTFCCKGVCDTLEVDRVPTGLRYKLGHKRCTLCSIFLETDCNRCPCCGVRLRTKSRNKKSRKKLYINNVKHILNIKKSN